MKGMGKVVSVFTATYNRAYILEKLYISLLRQTNYDFEWIIVDDGSQDRTEDMVNSWIQNTRQFPIIYKKTSNGGKHRAINYGVALAQGEAFFIVDSDDVLIKDAIEFINDKFDPIVDNSEFAGISGVRVNKNGEIIGGTPCFSDFVDATNFERKNYSLTGDKAEVYKASILRKYPFPEFDNETFLTEAVVWDAIAFDGLKLRWYNKPLYYTEYLIDGLTRNSYRLKKNNPLGWAEWIRRERSYGRLMGQELTRVLFAFIECVDLCPDVACSVLEISKSEYDILCQKKERFAERIKNEIESHMVRRMALYGYGYNARRLMGYLDDMMTIEIPYVIDRNYANIREVPAYPLYTELPMVDSVCITLRKAEPEIRKALESMLPNSYIWQLADLEVDEW